MVRTRVRRFNRALALVRRDGFDCGCEPSMNFRVNRPMPDVGTRRIFAKEVVAFPVLRRPDGPWDESAAAVRAYVFQGVFDARCAKCALVGADTRFQRVGRQSLVAILTSRSELEHAVPFCSVTAEGVTRIC